jgi:hypothetical protein
VARADSGIIVVRMSRATPPPAFRALERRLLARRASEMGPRLWLVALALAACVAAFTYWQVRVPLDGARRHGGVPAATQRLALTLGAIALAGGALAFWRRSTLAVDPPGPEWLALPVEPAQVGRHLDTEALVPALGTAVPAGAAWLAGWGLLPAGTLVLLAPGFALALAFATWLACALALLAASRAKGAAARLPAAWRALVSVRSPASGPRVSSARFRVESRPGALARLDRAVSLRAGSPRLRLAFASAALATSFAAWFAASEPFQARALAFAAFALAFTELGAWAAWRAAGDPAPAVRPLPLSLGDSWRARAWPLLLVLIVALVVHALVAAPLPVLARIGLPLAWALPAVLLAHLGLHLGLSLAGRPAAAESLYYAWLVTAVLASITIPLLGWAVLAAAFAQATRRLPRWHAPEPA